MTVMAAEAGTGAAEAEGAEASSAGRQATMRTRTVRAATASSSGPRRVATRVAKATPQGRAANRASRITSARRPPSRGRRAATSQPAKKLTGNYHGAVFVEFVLAVLLVAAIPFSKPNRTGVSPYAGKDMIQLLAITVLYFLLAVLAATGRTQARFAAWFGGLILLAVGLAEAANVASAVSSWFGSSSSSAATTTATGNASVVNPGESPTGVSRAVAQEPGNGIS